MTTLPTTDEVLRWIGQPVQDSSGAHLGSCQNVYADDDTDLPEWVEVALPSDGVAFVPIVGASSTGEVVRVAHAGEQIAASPRFASDQGLSASDEKALYEHYGVAYSGERSDSLLPADAATGTGTEAAAEPRPRRLRRVEVAPPADVTPPAPALSTPPPFAPYEPADSGSAKGRLAVVAAAVPALLLLGRKVRQRREPSAVQRQAPRAGVLLAPAAACVLATLVQRRRSRTPVTPAVLPTPHVVQPPEVVDRETHTPV